MTKGFFNLFSMAPKWPSPSPWCQSVNDFVIPRCLKNSGSFRCNNAFWFLASTRVCSMVSQSWAFSVAAPLLWSNFLEEITFTSLCPSLARYHQAANPQVLAAEEHCNKGSRQGAEPTRGNSQFLIGCSGQGGSFRKVK